MSVEALWVVRFATLDGAAFDQGGGVLVLETGRVLGGDSGAFYVGNYTLHGSQIEFRIKVGFHDTSVPSIFGPGFVEYTLLGRGALAADHQTIDMEGAPELAPQRRLVARLTRLAELP